MKKSIFIILISVIMLKAGIGDWKTFCSISQGNDIISNNGKIYIATDGGLIEYSSTDSLIYDTDNGLFKINTTSVEVDFRNIIWAGHSDCSISLFDENGNSVGSLNDIEDFGSYELNGIYSSDNYIYVATDQVLVRYIYNPTFNKYEVKGSNMMTGNVSDVIVSPSAIENYIYIAASGGVYSILEASSNIGYMDNWTLLSGFDPNTVVNKFMNIGDIVIALTSNGIYSIDGNMVIKESLADGVDILWGEVYNDEFYYLIKSGDVIINKSDTAFPVAFEEVYRTNDQIAERFLIENDMLYYISESGFSSFPITGGITTDHIFNLPAEKGIRKIRVTNDNSKLLYLTSFGFRSFDMFAEEFNDEFYRDSKIWQAKNFIEDNEENIYVCTWSTGIAKLAKTADGYDFEQRYSFDSPVLVKYPTHPGVCKDTRGNLWFTNYHNTDLDSTIVKLNTNGSIDSYTYSLAEGVPPTPFAIYVDQNDWVWTGSSSEQFNERDGLTVGIVKNGSLEINNFTGLGGIISINKDNNGFVWIGTNNGIKYIDMTYADAEEPSDLLASDITSIIEGPVGNMIYDIEISEINEKWFATDKGVSVLSSDNSRWRHYVPVSYKDNGRLYGDIIYGALPDNTITDIELNKKEGLAIFSSYNGITLFKDASLINRDNIDEVITLPSPFITDGSSIMSFVFPADGNNYNSVKIFDLNGRLIKGGTGSEVFSIINGWNGRDNNGKIVSTGIYQVIAYNDVDPTIKIIGKIAVVRR